MSSSKLEPVDVLERHLPAGALVFEEDRGVGSGHPHLKYPMVTTYLQLPLRSLGSG